MKKGYFDGNYDTGEGNFHARYHVLKDDDEIYVSEVEVLDIPEDSCPEGWEHVRPGFCFDPGNIEITIPDESQIIWEQ